MSKSRCFAFLLAVVLLSLEADAQPTVDETTTCSSSTADESEVVNMFTRIVSNQQQNAKNINRKIDNIGADVKRLLASNPTASNPTDCVTVEPSKQALVSALQSNCVPLLIQQNVDGSNFFNRSWAEFKVGFNDSSGNYWLGNELLSQLTPTGRYKLKFDLQSRRNNSNWYSAEYISFIVLAESSNYTLHVSGYRGNAGFDALDYSTGRMFTTYDRDNDGRSSGNCAVSRAGGFWYRSCVLCGVNNARGRGEGFIWYRLPGGDQLQSSRMWLHCK